MARAHIDRVKKRMVMLRGGKGGRRDQASPWTLVEGVTAIYIQHYPGYEYFELSEDEESLLFRSFVMEIPQRLKFIDGYYIARMNTREMTHRQKMLQRVNY